MTSSLHSGIGFSRRALITPLFPYLTSFAAIFFFGRAIFGGRNFFSSCDLLHRNGETSPSSRSSPLSPDLLQNVGTRLLLQVLLSEFPLSEKHKNT